MPHKPDISSHEPSPDMAQTHVGARRPSNHVGEREIEERERDRGERERERAEERERKKEKKRES